MNPFGRGAKRRNLTPFKSVAVDPRLIPIGEPVYVPELDGLPLPDGSIPQDLIFAGGPDLSWEADIAWIIRGGADPIAWIGKYGDRITAVHVKDIAPAGEKKDEDGWADVGEGTVDWKGLFQALASTKARYFIAEHDNPSDFKRFAKRSLASIQSY